MSDNEEKENKFKPENLVPFNKESVPFTTARIYGPWRIDLPGDRRVETYQAFDLDGEPAGYKFKIYRPVPDQEGKSFLFDFSLTEDAAEALMTTLYQAMMRRRDPEKD